MKCFYHSADLDGHCSGAIVKRSEPDCEMIGYNYGKPFPWDSIDPSEEVYMVDVSLDIADMVKLARRLKAGGGHLVWIDHHIGIMREHAALPLNDRVLFDGIQDSSRAACELCWLWCFPGLDVPPAVMLLGIYDSWRFTEESEPEVKAFQYGMRMERETRPEYAMDFWNQVFESVIGAFMREVSARGETIYDYQMTQNEKSARACAFETLLHHYKVGREDFPPLRVIAMNSGLANSDVFKSVYDPDKHDAMLCFYRSKRGFWRCSIYSTQDHIDCSEYAKSYGGGGHKGAAGFRNEGPTLPFSLSAAE